MAELHFLPVTTPQSRRKTTREYELELSEIKSHAAKFSRSNASAQGQVERLQGPRVTFSPSVSIKFGATITQSDDSLPCFPTLPIASTLGAFNVQLSELLYQLSRPVDVSHALTVIGVLAFSAANSFMQAQF